MSEASPEKSESTLKVISRRKWGAQESKTPRNQRLNLPATFVRFVQTTTDAVSYEDCSEYMREHQKFRMYHGETDIPFNFVIGSDYKIYEGVGWRMAVDRGRKIRYLSKNCIDIGFIGDLEDGFMPTFEMLSLALDIIKHGIVKQFIIPNFKIIPITKWRPSYYVETTTV